MSLFEYIRDYFFPLMNITLDDDVPRLFLKAIGDKDKEQVLFWFPELERYVKEREKDAKNVYFNRMRCYINDEFSINLNYSHL